jgi:hemerythrin-like domain-containing protein
MEDMAKSVTYDDATISEAIQFLRHDMPLHVLDEEEDLFPLLRRRATPDDDLEHVLGVLSGQHRSDRERIESLLAQLIKAQKDRKAPSRDAALRASILDFVAHERRHVALENAVVLPIARLRLQAADLEALSARLAARRGRLLEVRGDE